MTVSYYKEFLCQHVWDSDHQGPTSGDTEPVLKRYTMLVGVSVRLWHLCLPAVQMYYIYREGVPNFFSAGLMNINEIMGQTKQLQSIGYW